MSLSSTLFRAYDIRGRTGDTLTEQAALKIGQAAGSEALDQGNSSILVARDGRLSSPSLTTALIEGLLSTGIDVVDLGQVPTPLLYFATHESGIDSGIMVTGSHNPPDYNGFKIVLNRCAFSGEALQDLQGRISRNQFHNGQGRLTEMNMEDRYLERLCRDVRLSGSLKIVIDAGNGVAGPLAVSLLRDKLGCEVIERFCTIDGDFPNHHPDPSRPENMTCLIDAVRETNADLGLAYDGDGDRLGVVDSNGHIVWPDRQMMLFASDVLKRQPGAEIIFDVKCSRHLEKVVKRCGGKPTMWKSGHSILKAKLRETQAPLAGEMSGHIFFGEDWYGFDDALYASVRLLRIVSEQGRSSGEIFQEFPEGINTPEIILSMEEQENFMLMDSLLKLADFPGATIDYIDGLRVDFDDSWGLVRASNTTPSLVFRFEADTAEKLCAVQDRFRDLVHAAAPDLKLPF